MVAAKRLSKRKRTRAAAKQQGYRSGYEANIARDLAERGIKFEYEPKTFSYRLPIRLSDCDDCGSKRVCRRARYLPDFKLSNGRYVEAKGKLTSANRTRLAAFRRQNPDLPFCILFQTDNWLTKKHKARYTDWAHKEGITCAVGKAIPEDWTK